MMIEKDIELSKTKEIVSIYQGKSGDWRGQLECMKVHMRMDG